MGKAQACQTAHANARRRSEQFHVGDMVMLSTDHVRQPHTQHARAKLRPRFTGPFKVTQVVNPSAYRLEFPEGFVGIYDVRASLSATATAVPPSRTGPSTGGRRSQMLWTANNTGTSRPSEDTDTATESCTSR